ncbi:hypothetical protein AYO40_00765 [Planctomycetaceae bacterium SCGC AG-212-D15]|nr:hypothetical protein AYO40_00765 [Planctomycetaceae bacterium SCGC AG-212-D15]
MCRNAECSRQNVEVHQTSVRFCEECGHAIEDVEVEVEVDAVEPWELEEELGGKVWSFFFNPPDELEEKGVHIWIRDEKKPRRDYCIDDDENGITELSPSDIVLELQEFSRKAAKELKALGAHYGADNVKVKWGVLHSVAC